MELYHCDTVNDNHAFLNREEGHHLTKVMRRKVGEIIYFTDGSGMLYSGEIVEATKGGVKLKIITSEIKNDQRTYHLHIAMVIPKSRERFEWFLEKAMEIGVDEITPLISDHSERRHLNMERTEKILISAAKQSLKYKFTKLNELTPFTNFISSSNGKELKMIGHCHAGDKCPISTLLGEEFKESNSGAVDLNSKRRVVALIGPEGDFSLEEVEAAIEAGFLPISLGESRLRVETAGLMIVSALYLLGN